MPRPRRLATARLLALKPGSIASTTGFNLDPLHARSDLDGAAIQRTRPTRRSSRSWPRRWPSAACRASSRRWRPWSAVMERAPAAFVRALHARSGASAFDGARPPLDPQPRPGGAGLAAAPDGARPRLARGVLRRRTCRRRRLDRGRTRVVLDTRDGARPEGHLRPPPPDAGRRLLLLAARRRAGPASASTCSCAGSCATTRVDLGLWSAVRPAQLVVPLDTHIIRVGRCLGMTRGPARAGAWRWTSRATLRQLNPDDPVRYDFSMCHLGMGGCVRFRHHAHEHPVPAARGVPAEPAEDGRAR